MEDGIPGENVSNVGEPKQSDLITDQTCLETAQLTDLTSCEEAGHTGMLDGAENNVFAPAPEQLLTTGNRLDISNSKYDNIGFQFSNADNIKQLSVLGNVFLPKTSDIHSEQNKQHQLNLTPSQEILQSTLMHQNYGLSEITQNQVKTNVISEENIHKSNIKTYAASSCTTQELSDVQGNKQLYSNILVPPNAKLATSGCAPDCGVSFERLPGISLETYAWAVTRVLGKDSITHIGRNPANEDCVLVFLKTNTLANTIVSKGIWIKNKWFMASYFQEPAIRLTISGILPFLPDTLIIDTMKPYGKSVYSVLRRIPAAIRSQALKGISSFRREIYLVRNETVPLPEVVELTFLGIQYKLEVSSTGPKCFNCGSTQHSVNSCDFEQQLLSSTETQEPDNIKNKFIDTSLPSPSQDTMSVQHSKSVNTTAKNILDNGITKNIIIKNREFYSQCNLANLPKLQKMLSDSGEQTESPRSLPQNVLLLKKNTGFVLNKAINTIPYKVNIDPQSLSSLQANIRKVQESETLESSQMEEDHASLNSDDIDGGETLSEEEGIAKNKRRRKKKDFKSDTSNYSSLTPEQSNIEMGCSISSLPGKHVLISSKETLAACQYLKEYPSSKVFNFIGDEKDNEQSKEENIAKAIDVAQEWCNKVMNLKSSSKKKIAKSFITRYPDLQVLLTIALECGKVFPASSAKYRKIKELLEEARLATEKARATRVKKRRQDSLL